MLLGIHDYFDYQLFLFSISDPPRLLDFFLLPGIPSKSASILKFVDNQLCSNKGGVTKTGFQGKS